MINKMSRVVRALYQLTSAVAFSVGLGLVFWPQSLAKYLIIGDVTQNPLVYALLQLQGILLFLLSATICGSALPTPSPSSASSLSSSPSARSTGAGLIASSLLLLFISRSGKLAPFFPANILVTVSMLLFVVGTAGFMLTPPSANAHPPFNLLSTNNDTQGGHIKAPTKHHSQ